MNKNIKVNTIAPCTSTKVSITETYVDALLSVYTSFHFTDIDKLVYIPVAFEVVNKSIKECKNTHGAAKDQIPLA